MNTTSLRYGEVAQLKIDLVNLQGSPNNVSVADKWPLNVPGWEWVINTQCGRQQNPNGPLPQRMAVFPYGLAVFSGYFDEGNVSQGVPLPIESYGNPSISIGCDGSFVPLFYIFGTGNENSTLYGLYHYFNAFRPANVSMSMQYSTTVGRYWDPKSIGVPSLSPFPLGVYTLASADEWGHYSVIHFSVHQ